ncbi:hypothetical protein M9H77_17286 [Catharanthus roseus]|uniref:Uncharacterized protein n=1 Tax=Catharanthus roseus TaxID=4058 RepID=A0ACC0B4J5_CATRO|nr:hypothetical protein M9H77_17286 [Catharanthus roseus]
MGTFQIWAWSRIPTLRPQLMTECNNGRAANGSATLVANDPEIPVSNIIQKVQVMFQIGYTYKRAWYARKFAIERPVISVDGTHLRGPYKGVLLIASSWDANNHFFLLAFAIVDKESSES